MARDSRRETSVAIFPGGALFPWVFRNRYALLQALVDEPLHADPRVSRARFDRTTKRATRFLSAHFVVTILLAFGVVGSFASVLFAALATSGFGEGAGTASRAVAQIAAWAGSASLVLLGLRMSLERAIARFDIVANFLAARLGD